MLVLPVTKPKKLLAGTGTVVQARTTRFSEWRMCEAGMLNSYLGTMNVKVLGHFGLSCGFFKALASSH